MNSKNIGKSLNSVLKKWVESIDNAEIRKTIKDNAIITGGALVSLLVGDEPNDYDVYFKTYDSCLAVAKYYANRWNETHDTKVEVIEDTELFDVLGYESYFEVGGHRWTPEKEESKKKLLDDTSRQKRITCFIRSKGVAVEDGESPIDDSTEPQSEPQKSLDESGVAIQATEETAEEQPIEKLKYRPRYFSSNAISLSDKIQLVIRFYGEVDKIHENYDFVHCTCSYDFKENKVDLPPKALEAIINKELYYSGSKYPLCSIIRTRKFIQRGWSINAGQYLKMCLQLNELNLKDMRVFKDQLAGVDSAYFEQAINAIQKKKEEDPSFSVDNTYLFEVINRIF